MKCESCNRNAVDFVNNKWCCTRHSKLNVSFSDYARDTMEETHQVTLYTYPEQTKLCELITEDRPVIEGTYMNFKLCGVIQDEEFPLVMMREDITPANIQRFIKETVIWMEQFNNSDMEHKYILTAVSSDFYINRITYDQYIFRVYLNF